MSATANEELLDCADEYASSPDDDGDVNFEEVNPDNLLRCLQTHDCRALVAAVENKSVLANAFVKAGSLNHVDLVAAFVHNGMTVDIINSLGSTALMNSSRDGNEECVRLLLDHDADVNVQDDHGWTALMYACASHNYKVTIAEMLLEKNCDVNVQNKYGLTALMCASQYNRKETVQLLLNYNADIKLKSDYGNAALDLTSNDEIKEMLLNHVDNSYVLK